MLYNHNKNISITFVFLYVPFQGTFKYYNTFYIVINKKKNNNNNKPNNNYS